VWELKDRGLSYTLNWKILRRGLAYRPGQKSCDLCLSEKLEILKRSSDRRHLNTRSELLRKCNHRKMHLGRPEKGQLVSRVLLNFESLFDGKLFWTVL
jgi:hypothetical protein